VLPEALAAVVAQRPHAEVHLDEGDPEEVISGVLEGEVDAAVVFEYDLDPREWPSELYARELLAEPLRLALPANHSLAADNEVHIADLADQAWICTRSDTGG